LPCMPPGCRLSRNHYISRVCQADFRQILGSMRGKEGCPPHASQVLFCLPEPQRCAQRLLSAERSSLAALRAPAPAAALARHLLLLGALTGVHAADRADFLRRLAAERQAAGASSPPGPAGQSPRTCGAEAGPGNTGRLVSHQHASSIAVAHGV